MHADVTAAAIQEAAAWTLGLCDRIAAETDVPGTITRLFLSPATVRVHALLRAEMEALGLTVTLDSAANLRGMYTGAEPALPVLLLGSHIDTVPDAGRFDGVLGVAAALAIIRLLHGRRLPFAIEVIAFSEEEGVRFRLPFLGSRGLLGSLGDAELARADADGVSVRQALRDYLDEEPSLPGTGLLTCRTFAFVELHIEQGPVLESLSIPLGVVGTIVGQTRLELTWRGEANHAGTTPMHLRHDALAAAAEFILAVEAEARKSDGLVATVGVVQVSPGAANIVPGQVLCSLDARHAEDAVRAQCVGRLTLLAQDVATRRGCRVETRETSSVNSVAMAPALVAGLDEAARLIGCASIRMNSGAGHDAMMVASAVPAAMLFVRTPQGLSHHPDEAVQPQDLQAALAVLLLFVEHLRADA
jgi:allantoate deiminase